MSVIFQHHRNGSRELHIPISPILWDLPWPSMKRARYYRKWYIMWPLVIFIDTGRSQAESRNTTDKEGFDNSFIWSVSVVMLLSCLFHPRTGIQYSKTPITIATHRWDHSQGSWSWELYRRAVSKSTECHRTQDLVLYFNLGDTKTCWWWHDLIAVQSPTTLSHHYYCRCRLFASAASISKQSLSLAHD